MRRLFTVAVLVASLLVVLAPPAAAATIHCARHPLSGFVQCPSTPAVGDTLVVNWVTPRLPCTFDLNVTGVAISGGQGTVDGHITAVRGRGCRALGFAVCTNTSLVVDVLGP